MNRHSVNPLIFLSLFILSWQALAQQTSSTLEDLVVTGTRTPKAASQGPVKTEMISSEEIKERHYRDASEALMDIPGLTLVDSTGKEGKSAIMQGMGGEHVLVLIDGAPLMQNASSGVDLSHLPASDIERIEVVKGGSSSLYGGQAMGGVINVITKGPTEHLHYELELGKDQSFTTDLDPGYQDSPPVYSLAKAHLSGRLNKTGYQLSATQRKNKSLERDAKSLSRDTPDLDRLNLNLTLEHKLTPKNKLQLELGHSQEKSRSYSARLQPDSSWSATTNDGEVARTRIKVGYLANLGQSATLNLYLLSERTNDLLSLDDDPRTIEPENLKTSIFGRDRAETQFDFSPADGQITTLGFVAEKNALDQSNAIRLGPGFVQRSAEVDAKSSSTLEAYAQNDWMFEHHEFIAGLRLTQDPSFGQHLDPKINYFIKPQWFDNLDSALRFSIGSGYRIPNLKERFYILDHRAFAGYIVYGNENLRPEESLSYQAGVELNSGRNFSISTNLFVNQVKGLILSIEEPSVSSERIFRFKNLNEALIYGLETSLSWQATSHLKWTPSLTYTKAVDPNTQLIVPNRPFYTAQMNLRFDVGSPGSNINASFRYFGDSYANLENTEMYAAYSIFDLRYNHSFSKNFEVYIGGKNIFDTKRAARADSADIIYDQRPGEGRMIVIGLSLEG